MDEPEGLTANRGRAARAYVYANAFEFWLGIGALLAGLTFFVNPSSLASSSVGEQAGVLAEAWSLMYTVGGGMVCGGLLLCLRPYGWRVELAGLSLLGSAMLVNAVSIIAYRGWTGVATVLTYVTLACATFMRARVVLAVAKQAATA